MKYTCHKEVDAFEIKSVFQISGSSDYNVSFTDGNSDRVGAEVFQRYMPVEGDFLVRYDRTASK